MPEFESRRIIRRMLTEMAVQAPSGENFAQWFSGSKVVDEDGNPLPMFHGTSADQDFDVFWTEGPEPDYAEDDDMVEYTPGAGDPNIYLGAHFTGSPSTAGRLALGKIQWMKSRVRGGSPRTIPVFLSIKNPLRVHNENELNELIAEYAAWRNDWTDSNDVVEAYYYQYEEGGDEYPDEDSFYEAYEEDPELRVEVINTILTNLSRLLPYDGFSEEDLHEQVFEEIGTSAKQGMIEDGYDGVVYPNEVEGGGESWIAFHPNQIKSPYAFKFDPESSRFTEDL